MNQGTTDESQSGFTARIKISGPEQIYSYLVQLVNLLVCMIVFTVLMATDPSYKDKMAKVEAASGLSMSVFIYIVAPSVLLLSALTKLLFHATSEPFKTTLAQRKWEKQQFLPRPKNKIKLRKISIPEGDKTETPDAEFAMISKTIHENRQNK